MNNGYGYGNNFSSPSEQNHTEPIVIRPAPEQKNEPPRKKNNGVSTGFMILLFVVCLLISVVGGFVAGYVAFGMKPSSGSAVLPGAPGGTSGTYNPVVLYQNVADVLNAEDIKEGTVTSVAAAVENSVVEITTEKLVTGSYFGQYIAEGAGSGIVISDDGYIATNNHVIESAKKITVRLKNGDTFEATVVGADSESDVAVVKIDVTGLTPVVFSDPDRLQVGETVVAVGNPLGSLGGSVTSGIISSLKRQITVEGQEMTLLQTDTAINPGNSGGGLFNLRGELVGIVNAKNTGEAIEGIGFAIPVSIASTAVSELIEYGYVRGRIDFGLSTLDVSDIMTAAYYRVNNYGCYIMSSKYTDELKQWDRVTAVNGNAVTYSEDIAKLKSGLSVGDTVTFTIVRDGKVMDVELVVHEKTPDGSDINFET